MHILFVEDNANTAKAMQVMLELKGYTVDTAATVAEAVERISSHTYDLLISDITLPDGTGYDILARAPTRPPAIAISGYTSAKDREESISKGFSEFVTKPFGIDQLLDAIETFIAK